MTIKGYRCPNCGNMLKLSGNTDILKCECCGSEYKANDENKILYKVEHLPYNTATLACKAVLPSEMLIYNPKEALEYSLRDMARKLAEDLLPFMDVDIRVDHCIMRYEMYSKLRVAFPSRPYTDILEQPDAVFANILNLKEVK